MWDDFKAHLCPEVKNFFLSQDNLDVYIFPGGLKAVVHLIDKVINKLFNYCFCDLYDQYMLTIQFLPDGNPKPPTR